jgi:hypothetical protein
MLTEEMTTKRDKMILKNLLQNNSQGRGSGRNLINDRENLSGFKQHVQQTGWVVQAIGAEKDLREVH